MQGLLKRTFDILAAATALLLAAPVIAVVALAIRFRMGGPVIFRQPRGGLGGRVFHLYKFRTMSEARDRAGQLLPDSERLTPLGRWLRAASLDELPQLVNVLRGEMSMVGPRPLHSHYLARYNGFQRRRHLVRPGLTGWAQVHGRNSLDWEQKFELDVWYVDHHGWMLDLKILALTLSRLLWRQGISQAGHATMPEFQGSEPELQRFEKVTS